MRIKPVYENKKAPCFSQDHLGQGGCPALNDIPSFLYAINQKNFALAFEILKQTNPFSGGCGRFCDHPCEKACNRGKYDESVNIRDLERFTSDWAFNQGILPDKIDDFAGKSAAIIGGGPAGLTAAYFLKQEGFKVDVFDRAPLMGGMMALGIPVFRYPTEILNYEIEYIRRMGVNMFTEHSIAAEDFNKLNNEYDYVIAGTGAHKARKMGITGEKSTAVQVGLDFLKKINENSEFREKGIDGLNTKALELGDSVAVIGGGYTAIDVARSAARLGKKVTVFYRRSESDMSIHPGEVAECEKEGIEFRFFLSPSAIDENSDGRSPSEFILEKMDVGEIGADGKSAIIASGETERVKVHNVLKAIGEVPDLSYLPEGYEIRGNEVTLPDNKKPIYIAGDARYGFARDVGMVVRAIGSGRNTSDTVIEHALGKKKTWYKEKGIAYYNTIKTRYFKPQARTHNKEQKPDSRVKNFTEISDTLTENEAVYSASRCFYCGICITCDWCYHYSHGAITKNDESWDGSRDHRYFRFIEENTKNETRESVESCPRNAMGFAALSRFRENDEYAKDINDQYISIQELSNSNKQSNN